MGKLNEFLVTKSHALFLRYRRHSKSPSSQKRAKDHGRQEVASEQIYRSRASVIYSLLRVLFYSLFLSRFPVWRLILSLNLSL